MIASSETSDQGLQPSDGTISASITTQGPLVQFERVSEEEKRRDGDDETGMASRKSLLCICCWCSSAVAFMKVKVRRYVYHDVVRLDDLEKLIDCSYVQPYTINSAKVVFLKQRPQSRPCKGSANICLKCDRILQDPFHFCSLSCKVDHVVLQGGDLSSILYRFDESDFAFSQIEGLRMDSAEALEEEEEDDDNDRINPDSISFSSSQNSNMKNKRSNSKNNTSGFLPNIVLSLSRRKGAPHRSPLS
ncbi:hypothetical protein Syun_010492 [Stephania yunnanensis]|uniref:PLATZ transcription factor family protein n=1 Tax=Stephania yunnanensis TaxID=152371 RepID=A0AAP0PPP1_9MAGN